MSAAERGELTATLAAVLDRDPAAVASVRERLSARRDAAAAALAFEFAARLQGELEALAWVTAEQKVTRATPDDFDVCGWADGLLIRFTVRGGRLSGWTQRACAAAAAPPGRGRARRRSGPGSPVATPSWRPGSFPRPDPRAETTATAGSDCESSFWAISVVSSFIPWRRLDPDGAECEVWPSRGGAWACASLALAGAGAVALTGVQQQ